MSHQSSATSAELAAEFERAMGSLATAPVANNEAERIIAALDRHLGNAESYIIIRESSSPAHELDDKLADTFTRIAAIALEGAARLRRQS
jgi:hypothetical protein